ncbi:MAG: ATP-dependent zinc protease family protein [Candidatus Poseidoniales archaeon]|jgi:hypothetical protein|tara:strand:+ start:752 stop:1222 length:471 start_codon:yes stop_codon:yes gene_type:complete
MKIMSVGYVIIGWREWVRIPDLESNLIMAKTDTGAWSNALNALDIEIINKENNQFTKFKLIKDGKIFTRKIVRWRKVRDTSGRATLRPVISTKLEIAGRDYQVEICLQNRSKMKHRIILGRNFLRNGFIVSPSRQCIHTMIGTEPRIIIKNDNLVA